MGKRGRARRPRHSAALAPVLGRRAVPKMAQTQAGTGKCAKTTVSMDDVRAWLDGQEKGALVEMIMERASEDDRLRQQLLMSVAKRRPHGLDLGPYRGAIANAIDVDGYVEYGEAFDYANRIGEAIDAVEGLLKEGHAAQVVELAEYGLETVEEALGSVDDSAGRVGGTLARLQQLHLAACKKAKPDPEELAKRLYEWELGSDWSVFEDAAATYAGVLGKKGLVVYRKLAEAEWASVPVLEAGQRDPERCHERYRITRIMETLAKRAGDVEALIAIKKRDLSTAYAYLEIAKLYKEARQSDLALEWAEKGAKAFPERTDSRLSEFLAAEYHRRKRHDEAMSLIWVEFVESPDVDSYQKLKSHADRIGAWTSWREKALATLRETIAAAKRDAAKKHWSWASRTDHSELVRIFLWEKDIEAAWREAKEGGCSSDLWLELAAKREEDHPEDALSVYQGEIEPTLAAKNYEAYNAALGLLRKVRMLMVRLGREAEFNRYLESLRAEHRPKRNFMKLLAEARWA
ncbi:MAG: DUF6880 family protein [Planctomycetota bacterium]